MARIDKTPLDKPTRAGLNELTKDLLHHREYPEWDTYRKLDEEYDRLVEEFRCTPKMKALRKATDKARQASDKRFQELRARARAVRLKYLAEGVTPVVLHMIRKLVDDINANPGRNTRRHNGQKDHC